MSTETESISPKGRLLDGFGRPLRDLRISVTDRCNFSCTYCMPREVFGRHHTFLPRNELLSFEEIARLVRIFVDHGVRKIRITGGEPLVRRDVERLIGMLARIDGLISDEERSVIVRIATSLGITGDAFEQAYLAGIKRADAIRRRKGAPG